MPVSSLIIRTEKEKIDDVAKHLYKFKQITLSEVHNEDIIVITETQKQTEDKALWDEIGNIKGVLKCDLIYHNFEDEEVFDHGK